MIKRKCSFKVFNILLLLLITFTLSSCDAFYYIYHSNTRGGSEVIEVQLINYTSDEVYNEEPVGYLDINSIIVLEVLDDNNLSQFLIDIEEVGGLAGKFDQVMDYPSGVGVLIKYVDGGITIATIDPNGDKFFTGDYNSEYDLEGFYGIAWQEMIDEFYDLLDTYFEYDLTE